MLCFKKQYDLNKRIQESNAIMAKYPDRIPIILQCDNKELASMIKKRKFLVPRDIQVSYLLSIIRGKAQIDSSKAIMMFHDNKMLNGTNSIGTLYEEYIENIHFKSNGSDESRDKFFYVTLQFENTFG